MLRFLFAAVGAGLCSYTAAAQTPDTAAAPRRHELGLTASPVLDKFFRANRALPVGLLYRRPLRPGRALRLRLVGQYARRDTSSSLFEYRFQRTTWQVQAFGGYEWQHPLSRRVQVTYGSEIGISYERDVQKTYGVNSTDYVPALRYWATLTTQRRQMQVRPFAGLNIRLARRMTLFVELATTVYYQRNSAERYGRSVLVNGNDPQEGINLRLKSHGIQVQFRPIQLIGASFAW